ncbi:MAG: DUF1428 domain-containing protein [Solirubrobacterales bacterium]
MAKYMDGFVVAVPRSKLDEHKKLARAGRKAWLEGDALDHREFVADDVPYGKETWFPRAVARRNSETVVFSWITYKSRAHRDRVNEKVMKEPKIIKLMEDAAPVFDASRMIWGGFSALIQVWFPTTLFIRSPSDSEVVQDHSYEELLEALADEVREAAIRKKAETDRPLADRQRIDHC